MILCKIRKGLKFFCSYSLSIKHSYIFFSKWIFHFRLSTHEYYNQMFYRFFVYLWSVTNDYKHFKRSWSLFCCNWFSILAISVDRVCEKWIIIWSHTKGFYWTFYYQLDWFEILIRNTMITSDYFALVFS